MTQGSNESPSSGMSRDQHGRGPGPGRGGPNDPNYGGGPNGPGGFGNHARQLTHQQRNFILKIKKSYTIPSVRTRL